MNGVERRGLAFFIACLLVVITFLPASALSSPSEASQQPQPQTQPHVEFGTNPWGHLPIKVYIDESTAPESLRGTYRKSVLDALQYWEWGEGREYLRDKLGYEVYFSPAESPDDADICVRWVRGLEGGKAGECEILHNGTSFLRAEIILECGHASPLFWHYYDDERMSALAKHEIGHALGLQYSDDPGSIMHPSFETEHDSTSRYLHAVLAFFAAVMLVDILIFLIFGRKALREQRRRRLEEIERQLFETKKEVPKKEKKYMEFRCAHCGYVTADFREIEMKRCPKCGGKPLWLSLDLDTNASDRDERGSKAKAKAKATPPQPSDRKS